MKREQRMMLQGGVTYEKEAPERKIYIANLMYRYPEETETIELIPTETIVYNNSFGRTNGIVEQGRLRDIREEQEIRAREARLQRRNTSEKPARQRIDYINKVGNVKDFGVPQVNENIVMKAKTKRIQTPSKDYNEIASLMYPTMEEKSQIQVKKKEPVLLGETSILKEPDMITLADKEYEVKPVDKKEENKDKEMEAEKKTDWIMPVNGRISSDYGMRFHPIEKKDKFHNGWDIAVPVGTPIKAVANGEVIKSGKASGYGYSVVLNHGMINGKIVTSEYGHISKWVVNKGEHVKQGQIIAYSGNTGSSNGPHLHFTIREGYYRGIGVSPAKYIDKNKF